jgi:perosamine synthetase
VNQRTIPLSNPDIDQNDVDSITDAARSGWVSSKGPYIRKFEEGFSDYIGTRFGVSTSNGTAALHLALVALGVGKGDEVLVPSLTFISPANAATYTGARAVFVDSSAKYWCIDPRRIGKAITRKTKAVIVVHLYGHPCDMDPIVEEARRHGLFVIEDCAEAHGAEYKHRKVGSLGDISCFSFYGNKIITTGEGGMCLSDDESMAERLRVLRDHGMRPDKKYMHDEVGFNYRMTNLQAALGVSQLAKIRTLIEKKREIAHRYQELFAGVPGLVGPPEMDWAYSTYWLYSVLVGRRIRDTMLSSMYESGVEVRPFFYPTHKQLPYRDGTRLRVAEDISSRGINLPSGPRITEDDISTTAETLIKSMKQAGNYQGEAK